MQTGKRVAVTFWLGVLILAAAASAGAKQPLPIRDASGLVQQRLRHVPAPLPPDARAQPARHPVGAAVVHESTLCEGTFRASERAVARDAAK